jgi:transketolase
MNRSAEILRAKADWVWRETLAIHRRAPETRIASSLSPIEIFVALYYGNVLRYNAKQPLDDARDRCVISKGHGSICMYPILADLGYFPKEELLHVCEKGSFLGGIPDPIIPGYETLNGSLGHGLGVAAGMALGLKRRKNPRSVFVIVGDGELHEGANWEAIMFAAHHQLDNLHVIVDNNHIAMLGHTEQILAHGSLPKKFMAFGWEAQEVDGHDVDAVQTALLALKESARGKAKLLVAHTLKGRGVPGLENAPLAHIMNPKPAVLDAILGTN